MQYSIEYLAYLELGSLGLFNRVTLVISSEAALDTLYSRQNLLDSAQLVDPLLHLVHVGTHTPRILATLAVSSGGWGVPKLLNGTRSRPRTFWYITLTERLLSGPGSTDYCYSSLSVDRMFRNNSPQVMRVTGVSSPPIRDLMALLVLGRP